MAITESGVNVTTPEERRGLLFHRSRKRDSLRRTRVGNSSRTEFHNTSN